MKANKIKILGVRAALIHDHFSARQGVEDAVFIVARYPCRCRSGKFPGMMMSRERPTVSASAKPSSSDCPCGEYVAGSQFSLPATGKKAEIDP
jgi:hypothetical protein